MIEGDQLSKRALLSQIARIFDPLVLLSCVTITGKILLQRLWIQGINWDDVLSENLQQKIREWLRALGLLNSLHFTRHLGGRPNVKMRFHAFCDASEKLMESPFT